METRYMFNNKYTAKGVDIYNTDWEIKKDPYIVCVEDGVILPAKMVKEGPDWGLGGVIDKNGRFISESAVETGFGGAYDYDSSAIASLDETVLFIPMIPNQWGHILINAICRLWPEDVIEVGYKVLFCGWGWSDDRLSENAYKIFELAGIPRGRMQMVTEPVRVSRIIIPSESFGYEAKYNAVYCDIINRIKTNALLEAQKLSLKQYGNIYFTRTSLKSSKHNEVGEKEIEALYRDNGWAILSPEKLSVVEQIFYISSTQNIASMIGSVSHNAVFMGKDSEWTIINKTCVPNPPQIKICKLFNINCTFVDCYTSYAVKKDMDYGLGPYAVEITDNLRRFVKNRYDITVDSKYYGSSIKLINWFRLRVLIIRRVIVKTAIGIGIKPWKKRV